MFWYAVFVLLMGRNGQAVTDAAFGVVNVLLGVINLWRAEEERCPRIPKALRSAFMFKDDYEDDNPYRSPRF